MRRPWARTPSRPSRPASTRGCSTTRPPSRRLPQSPRHPGRRWSRTRRCPHRLPVCSRRSPACPSRPSWRPELPSWPTRSTSPSPRRLPRSRCPHRLRPRCRAGRAGRRHGPARGAGRARRSPRLRLRRRRRRPGHLRRADPGARAAAARRPRSCRAAPARCCSWSAPASRRCAPRESLAASLRLDPDRVQWATRGDLAGLAPKGSRMTTVETAIDRRQDAADAGTVTIVAVDAPLRTDAYWMSQMLAIWAPVAVWAVVEATRKPEDLEPVDRRAPPRRRAGRAGHRPQRRPGRRPPPGRRPRGPPRRRPRRPPHRWASLLCERLESTRHEPACAGTCSSSGSCWPCPCSRSGCAGT